MEIIAFEITNLLGAYHAILGRPCYTKFMAVLNYTYLKLKILGPYGIITMNGDLHQAYSYKEENYIIMKAACRALELQSV